MKKLGMYIHIPFCKSKCYYCDFCSFENKEVLIPKYIKYLKEEIKDVAKGISNEIEVSTIYIGGGTPSYIESKYILEIMDEIKTNYNLNDVEEITIEANPATVNEEKLQDYISCGINRISIGLQSTDNNMLKKIGRVHTYSEFLETYKLARKVGFKNINVDLIIGLPRRKYKKCKNRYRKYN